MFSATKFVVPGAIVALVGGLLLVAQPFDQQGNVPGAATDGVGLEPASVTGRLLGLIESDMVVASWAGNRLFQFDGDSGAFELVQTQWLYLPLIMR